MKQLFRDAKGNVLIRDVASPSLHKGQLLVHTLYSVISSGTEKRTLASTKENYYQALKNPRKLLHFAKKVAASGNLKTMYARVKNKLDELVPLGYSCVGVVLGKGEDTSGFAVGDSVACMGPDYAMHAELISVPLNLAVQVPKNVDMQQAAFAALGCIALHALRNSKVQLGDTVAVVGLGLLGQILSRLLTLQGTHVLGMDLLQERLLLAKKQGVTSTALVGGKTSLSEAMLSASQGRGCDAVFLCTPQGSQSLFEDLGLGCRDRARFVLVGSFDAQIPYRVFYRKELEFVASRSTGPGRHDPFFEVHNQPYPLGFVPWTEKRNAEEFIHLLATKKLDVSDLISKEFPLAEGKKAYDFLKTKKPYGILLTYPLVKP